MMTTVERKFYESTMRRAQGFIARRTAAYKAEIALHAQTIEQCQEKLAEHASAEQNKAAAESELPLLKKKDRL